MHQDNPASNKQPQPKCRSREGGGLSHSRAVHLGVQLHLPSCIPRHGTGFPASGPGSSSSRPRRATGGKWDRPLASLRRRRLLHERRRWVHENKQKCDSGWRGIARPRFTSSVIFPAGQACQYDVVIQRYMSPGYTSEEPRAAASPRPATVTGSSWRERAGGRLNIPPIASCVGHVRVDGEESWSAWHASSLPPSRGALVWRGAGVPSLLLSRGMSMMMFVCMYVCLLRGTHAWEKGTERGRGEITHGRPGCPTSRAQHMLHEPGCFFPDAGPPPSIYLRVGYHGRDGMSDQPSTTCCMSQRLLPRHGSIAVSSLEEHGL